MPQYQPNPGLPEPLYAALTKERKSYCDYSVTELINPPQILQLSRRHKDELNIDCRTRMAALGGTGFHLAVQAPKGNHLSEESLISSVDGRSIGGTPDLLDADGILTDYKTTSVWTYIYGGREEWIAQCNMYAWLYGQFGFTVRYIRIVPWFKDWREKELLRIDGYPKYNVISIAVPLWLGETDQYIHHRVHIHKQAETLPDADLPNCLPEERWQKETVYAVMKVGQKSAIRDGLCETPEAAQATIDAATKDKAKLYVETRQGECIRCERYCDVKNFCPQYRAEHGITEMEGAA